MSKKTSKKDQKTSRNDKKGLMVDFFVVIGVAVVLIVFFILFWATKKEYGVEVKEEFYSKDAGLYLNAFLRAPATGVDDKKRVSEIIANEYITKNYAETTALFKSYFAGITTYNNEPIIEMCLWVDGQRRSCISYNGGLMVVKEGTRQSTHKTTLQSISGKEFAVQLQITTIETDD